MALLPSNPSSTNAAYNEQLPRSSSNSNCHQSVKLRVENYYTLPAASSRSLQDRYLELGTHGPDGHACPNPLIPYLLIQGVFS